MKRIPRCYGCEDRDVELHRVEGFAWAVCALCLPVVDELAEILIDEIDEACRQVDEVTAIVREVFGR